MQKIKLDLDTLAVDSFDTAAPQAESRGTVAAHINTIEVLRDYLSIAFCAAAV